MVGWRTCVSIRPYKYYILDLIPNLCPCVKEVIRAIVEIVNSTISKL